MTATNKTTVYELPIFVATDKPTWLGDFNGAMNSIEAGLVDAKNSSTTVIQTANTALNIANDAKADVAAAASASNNAVAIATTAKNTADAATATATQAATTANTANANANAASANASQALTTVTGINTNPPAIFGVAQGANDVEPMPASPVSFDMVPISQQGVTWVPSSKGYRVDTAGVYSMHAEAGVKPTPSHGALWIMRNRAGTIDNLRHVDCPESDTRYTVDVSTILTLNTGDIITVGGDSATFYTGGLEFTIIRLGA